jgi:uncharacterized protein
LKFDRRWMLVDADNKFMTQREFPKMALIGIEVAGDHLNVSFGEQRTSVPFDPNSNGTADVIIWQSVVPASVYDQQTNEWFSTALDFDCRLVLMPESTKRTVNPLFAIKQNEDIVSFADGYPFLLIGEGSLADLNSRLDTPVPMNRFRPNFVVSGSQAFAEDSWKRVRIGETVFHLVKPCARCVITTVEQSRGEFDGKEPLKTLATYRLAKMVMPARLDGLGIAETAVLFGQNLIAENPGEVVRIGDKIEILDARP